jgi:hypothetical protein
MSARRIGLPALLLALALCSGCAGVIEFNTPAPYKDMKLKEDPPDTLLVPAPTGPQAPSGTVLAVVKPC